jgi:uncharacterized membrane protein YciS (DUF1049 family)
MIRLILLILILLAALGFGVKNAEQAVTLKYYFGLSTQPIPVYQVVLWTFVVSVSLVGILLFPEWIKMRLQLRRQRKTLERLEEELTLLKPSPPSEASGPQPAEEE